MNKLIHSNRLVMRTLDESCADQVLTYIVRNQQFLSEWEIRREASFYTIDEQRRLLSEEQIHMERGRLCKLWIYEASNEERIIGSISLSNIVRGAFQSCHLGYRLDKELQGKGYTSEALREMIAIAFHDLQLHRIEANIMPQNKASLRVVEKHGFQHEGLAKKYLKINGKWEDHIHMVLLNEEMEQE